MSKVTAVKRTTDVIGYKEGGNAVILKNPGRIKYEPITLKRGITCDTALSDWADKTQVMDNGSPGMPLASLRQVVTIVLLNEAGVPVHLHRCWMSEYQALPDLDAGANALAPEHIKLENEGWEFTARQNNERLET